MHVIKHTLQCDCSGSGSTFYLFRHQEVNCNLTGQSLLVWQILHPAIFVSSNTIKQTLFPNFTFLMQYWLKISFDIANYSFCLLLIYALSIAFAQPCDRLGQCLPNITSFLVFGCFWYHFLRIWCSLMWPLIVFA